MQRGREQQTNRLSSRGADSDQQAVRYIDREMVTNRLTEADGQRDRQTDSYKLYQTNLQEDRLTDRKRQIKIPNYR